MTMHSGDIMVERVHATLLDSEEAQLLQALDRMDPDYRGGFVRALIDNLLSLDLESPQLKARRERLVGILISFAHE
jgi:hypothetical protein